MWPWNASTQGHLYIFHFNAPLGNLANRRAQARHYCGFAENLDARLKKHMNGKGAKIVAAALSQGLIFEIYHWPACLAQEKLVKAHKRTADFCPACAAAAHRLPRALPVPTQVDQLTLPLDSDELPAFTLGRGDWLEYQIQREWRAAWVAPVGDLSHLDDLL
jgi:predicted GIY-YIG superfamily endonuclease